MYSNVFAHSRSQPIFLSDREENMFHSVSFDLLIIQYYGLKITLVTNHQLLDFLLHLWSNYLESIVVVSLWTFSQVNTHNTIVTWFCFFLELVIFEYFDLIVQRFLHILTLSILKVISLAATEHPMKPSYHNDLKRLVTWLLLPRKVAHHTLATIVIVLIVGPTPSSYLIFSWE